MKIYIAGPYTRPDPILNTREAIKAAEALIDLGHIPYVPHLTMLWHLVSPHPIEFWYEYDKMWILDCNAVLRLPGASVGADSEVEAARIADLPIYYFLDDIPKI